MCNAKDTTGHKSPLYTNSVCSHVLSHSVGPNHMEWHTNPDNNPYHPIHFDSNGNHEDHKTKNYKSADPDYHSKKDSYIGQKTPADLPTEFDVCNNVDPKTKE